MEANWWLIGFFFVMTFAGLTVVFDWWWLLAIPMWLGYEWWRG
jgi:hypothetical protein